MAIYFGPLRTVVRIIGRLLHGLATVSFSAPTITDANGIVGLNSFDHRDVDRPIEPLLVPAVEDLQTKPPSLYSGAMRLLAQYHYASAPRERFPYSYTFQTTHGLHVGADGLPWIIEINRTSSVYAIRLAVDEETPVNTGAPNDTGGFTFDPKIEPLPAKTDPRWRVLADATVFAGVTGSPWSDEGWAFNDSGASAVIVLVSSQGGYFYTRLYEITISSVLVSVPQTPNPPIDVLMPTSASVAELEGDFLWQRRRGDRTRLKAPLNGTIVSRDELWSGQFTAPADNSVAPVYAFYRNNVLEVVRWHYTNSVTTINNVAEPALDETGDFGVITTSSGTECYSSSQYGVVSNTINTGDITTRNRPVSVTGMVTYFNDDTATEASAIVDTVKTNANEVVEYWDTLILPIRDREAFYHFRETYTEDSHQGATVQHRGWLIPPGPVYRPRSTVYTGAGDYSFYEINFGAQGWQTPWPKPFMEFVLNDNMLDGASVRATSFVAPTITAYTTDLGDPRWQYFWEATIIVGTTAENVGRQAAARDNQEFVSVDLKGNGSTHGGPPENFWGSPGSGFEAYEIVTEDRFGTIIEKGHARRVGLVAFDPTPNTPTIDVSPISSKFDQSITGTAYLRGSVVSQSIAVSQSEIDWWVRQAAGDFTQLWLVTQDAAPDARLLYSKAPVPDGGNLAATLDGSAEYTPSSIGTELLSWVGKP